MHECARAPVGASIRARVGPFVQQRADEAFGLAVRLRAIGPREALRDAVRESDLREGEGAITTAIVGEYALDGDAECCVPRDRAPCRAARRAPWMRCPTRWMRPSFFTSRCTSSPGRSRSSRMMRRGPSTRGSRPRPRRRSSRPTVDSGSPMYCAMRRLDQRWPRRLAICRR